MSTSKPLAGILDDLSKQISSADEQELAYLGAGPLEDLLRSDNNEEYLSIVLDLARQNSKWRFALGCVWTTSFKNRVIAGKIEAIKKLYFPNGTP